MKKRSEKNRNDRQEAFDLTTFLTSGTTDKITDTEIKELLADIEELRLANRQMKRKIFDLYTVFEISRNFNSVLDYKTLLDTFIFTCLGQIGALKGAIFLKETVSATKFTLVKVCGSGELPERDAYFDEKSDLLEYLTRLNRPVLTGELSEDQLVESEVAILKGFADGTVVPLIHQTRLAGIFLLGDKISDRDLTIDDLEFLSTLSNQISVAIENARLYEAERSAITQLRKAQQQLVQSEKSAALGEMSAKIAHEVNNPLGIIKNYVLLLKKSEPVGEKAHEYCQIVSNEIDRIALIVRQLNDSQRQMKIGPKSINIITVLEETINLMDRQLRSAGIELRREWDSKPLVINGVADSLKQVFLNLIINARSAMESGGILQIKLDHQEDKLLISFCDTGGGIDPELIPRIFEPFFTTKGVKGTGLGLSVCHGIIKSHDGSITFKNKSQGGCFEILLPLSKEVNI